MKNNFFRRGFVLIIVIAILGVLATVALNFMDIAREQTHLSQDHIFKTKTQLLARSGVEAAVNSSINRYLMNPSSLVEPQESANGVYRRHFDLSHELIVTWRDPGGALNVNDGIRAGHLELGSSYQANAINPWVEDESSGAIVDDVSGLINLRIRRLLNAYGDVHKFIADIGMPIWEYASPSSSDPIYREIMTFTSTDAGDKYLPLPALDKDGNVLNQIEEIAILSSGLGDRILALRPERGYRNLKELEPLVDAWADEFLPLDYFPHRSFYDVVSADLCVRSFEDSKFPRMINEFGKVIGGDRSSIYNNDFKTAYANMVALDESPPDLSNIWAPHSTALINFNEVSTLARAALLYAPCNVSYLAEGAGRDEIPRTLGYGINYGSSPRSFIGVAGPYFSSVQASRENGEPVGQKNRLMSLRDALVVSQGYESWCKDNAWADSFDTFSQIVRRLCSWIRADGVDSLPYCQPPERAGFNFSTGFPGESRQFKSTYLEATLPHIFNPIRRLPGYLHAPIALLSPYTRTQSNFVTNQASFPAYYSLSVEDFVMRTPLPKICFLNSGYIFIASEAFTELGGNTQKSKIETTVEIFSIEHIKSQKEFQSVTDTASTDDDVLIGPEPSGVVPHHHLGVVGLRDRKEDMPSGSLAPAPTSYVSRLYFEDSMAGVVDDNFLITDSNQDDRLESQVVEDPVTPYPVPKSNTPFDAAVLTTLKTSLRPFDKTWRIPSDGFDVLAKKYIEWGQKYSWLDGEENYVRDLNIQDVTQQHLDDFLQYVFDERPRMPGYIPGLTNDEYVWAIHTLNPPDNIFTISWKDDWAPHWRDNVKPINDHLSLRDSGMEGESVSMFLPGASGSDMSPFGGLMFSERGHGTRAVKKFSDSLYYRPGDAFLSEFPSPGQNNNIGKHANRGLVSFWFRMPSGYPKLSLKDYRTLFHLTVWERFQVREQTNVDPSLDTLDPADSVSFRFRPTHLSAFLDPIGSGRIYFQYATGNADSNDAFEDVQGNFPSLTPINFPWSYGDLSQAIYTQSMGPLKQMEDPHSDKWFRGFTTFRRSTGQEKDWGGSHLKWVHGFISNSKYAFRPGSWQRVVCRWDLTDWSLPIEDKFQMTLHTTDGLVANSSDNFDAISSMNPNMILAFGEMPSDIRYYPNTTSVSNRFIPHSFGRPLVGDFVPLNRLNSSIDNIVMQFGDLPAPFLSGGDNSVAALSQLVEGDVNFRSLRYDIRTSSDPLVDREPRWVINPKLPKGARMLWIGSQIYDVPFTPHYGVNYQNWPIKAPRVDIALERNGALVPEVVSARPVIETGITLNSLEHRIYQGELYSSDMRMVMTWRNKDTNDDDLGNVLTDIPWIKNISWSYIPKNAVVLDWKANNF